MDILYIVGKGFSEWNDNELRYSLRSIAKNGQNVRRVYVCGYTPFWLNLDEVTLLPLRDPQDGNKHYNILRAIEYAVENSDISDHFLYSSDDHYYVQPTDFDNYPVYWRGKDIPSEGGKSWYAKTLKSTHDVLEAFGLPVRMYAWHGNTHFCKSLFLQQRMQLLRRLAQTMPEACEPSCLMLNYWQAVSPKTMPKRIARQDDKVGSCDQSVDIYAMAEKKEVLSSTDAVGVHMREFLMDTFPKKCKYEK